MQFQSARDAAHRAGLGAAIARGLAPEGGLYVPTGLPTADLAALQAAPDLACLAARLMAPFAAGDAMAGRLAEITRDHPTRADLSKGPRCSS